MMVHVSQTPPVGFRPLPVLNETGFDAIIGGFDVAEADGQLLAGFRVEPRHCNHAGTCHGGMIATVFDGYMAMAAMFEHDLQVPILPTMSLSVDFLAPGLPDDWIGFSADVLRVTRSAVFVQGLARVKGKPIARASGVYKRPAPDPEIRLDTGKLLRSFMRG
ncbi:putative esterase [Gluconacetobacter liquefaciens]|uniref:PaaI family thioesterase n=2 Tax=Gluconacetobacter liquefaciens TaxID=89584 RepID=A0A7W4JJK0_GLULI|nr:PaaI family thioesterase [Gluconacetobacter liquefaciens]MBB2185978.1 PaaI family thioesterase [Gluconacetobacter liquefaciens]GBQ99917.1 hypothetical protein AA0522_1306 [Gluconacetobacter liquefaciens NRIC 0522]GEB37609.1 putative esterase [Gluconacetobacter liquefaciens]